MKVKVILKKKPFLGSSESFASVVEQEINAWLEAHPRAKIHRNSPVGQRGQFRAVLDYGVDLVRGAEPAVAADRAGVTAFRTWSFSGRPGR